MEAAAYRRHHHCPVCAGGMEIYRLADATTTTAAVASGANCGALNPRASASDANRGSRRRPETAATSC